MIDIDYFKSINDVYGHLYGDIILKEFARHLKGLVRSSDIVARYGGEEFVIILPHTNKEGAITFGKSLWKAVGNHLFDPEGEKLRLKISLGISSFPEDSVGTASGLLDLADKRLLKAKEMGGNQISIRKKVISPPG